MDKTAFGCDWSYIFATIQILDYARYFLKSLLGLCKVDLLNEGDREHILQCIEGKDDTVNYTY